MNCISKSCFFAALAASTALILPGQALAQDRPAAVDRGRGEGDIVVTAQLRSQSLQEVPLAVTAVTDETLEANGVRSVQDLQLVSPAITFSQSTDALNAAVRIRGIGTQVFSISIEPSVSFVVDGVVLARTASALTDLVDIERVEVLRGPQSTLFGKNASAGVVSVVTKDPSKSFEATTFASLESDASVTLRAGVSGPLGDKAGIRLSGYYSKVVGHIDNVFDGRKLNGSTNYGIRGKLKVEPVEGLAFTLAADWRKSNSDCCNLQLDEIGSAVYGAAVAPVVPSPTNRKVNANAPIFSNTEDWGVSLKGEWDIGNALLTSITAYRGWNNDRNADIDNTSLTNPIIGVSLLDLNGAYTTLKTFTQEVRVNGQAFDWLDYVVGGFYSNFTLDTDYNRLIRACGAAAPGGGCAVVLPVPTRFVVDFKERNYSVFADGTIRVGDRFEVFGGLRYAINKQSAGYSRFGSSPLGPLADTGKKTAVMGRSGLRFIVSPTLSFYASYSRGFKFGSYDLSSGLTIAQFNRQPIAPETADAYEIGMRSQFFDRALTFNLTAFRTEYRNLQAQSYDPVLGQNSLVSAGTARTQGVELEVTARPVRPLTLSGGVTYNEAKFRSFPDGPCYTSVTLPATCRVGPSGVRLQDRSGEALPNSPKWKIVLSGRYDIVTELPFDMFVSASSVSQSKVNFSLDGNPRAVQKAYTIVNLNLGLQSKDGSKVLTFYARNLFDTSYAILRGSSPIDTYGISHIITRDASRILGASLKMDF